MLSIVFCHDFFISVILFPVMLWIVFSLSRESIKNSLSNSKVGVRLAYTLPSSDPILWDYTRYVVGLPFGLFVFLITTTWCKAKLFSNITNIIHIYNLFITVLVKFSYSENTLWCIITYIHKYFTLFVVN